MAQGWKYWDNDFHEWRYYEPDESDDFVTTLYSGYKVKNDTTKLPSLKIYDLLEAGFDEDGEHYDEDDELLDERCRTSKILKRYQHHQRVPKTALPRRRRVATPADKQLSSAQGQRFGLVEDRRLRRIVSNCFPTSRFSRLLNSQQHQICTESRNGRGEDQKLDSKMTTKLLVEIEPTIHRTPNPITSKKGIKVPIKKTYNTTTDQVNVPNELSSEKYKLITRQNQLKRVLSATHHSPDSAFASNLIRVKIKNLDDLTRANRQRNSSPLSYTIGRCQSAHLYRLDYAMQKEKAKNSHHEPMTCRKLLPNSVKQTSTTGNAKDILSSIQIDFESALAARKNGKNTYRKYANTKKWETSLREAKLQQAEVSLNKNMAITATSTFETTIETESPLASRAYGRSMPPPPSPIPQNALDQPD